MIDSYFLKTVPKFNLDVSRETLERLDEYSKDIILKNREINLISKSTESSIKSRLMGSHPSPDNRSKKFLEWESEILDKFPQV